MASPSSLAEWINIMGLHGQLLLEALMFGHSCRQSMQPEHWAVTPRAGGRPRSRPGEGRAGQLQVEISQVAAGVGDDGGLGRLGSSGPASRAGGAGEPGRRARARQTWPAVYDCCSVAGAAVPSDWELPAPLIRRVLQCATVSTTRWCLRIGRLAATWTLRVVVNATGREVISFGLGEFIDCYPDGSMIAVKEAAEK